MPIGTLMKKIQCQLMRLGERAAGQQPDRAARRGDGAVDADGLGLLARLGEHRDDHAEHHGRAQRAADALHEARRRSAALASGRGRRAAEAAVNTARPIEEDPPLADEVAEPPGEQQQAAERDQVRVDDPGEVALREAEVVLDRGQRDVHDRARRARSSGRRRTGRRGRASESARLWPPARARGLRRSKSSPPGSRPVRRGTLGPPRVRGFG